MKLISNPEPPHRCKFPRGVREHPGTTARPLQLGAVLECEGCGAMYTLKNVLQKPPPYLSTLEWERLGDDNA